MVAAFNPARKLALYCLALLSGLLVSACDNIGMPSTGPAVDRGQPVTVALLVPRNSGQPGDAILAQSLENSARMAIADLGGNPRIDLRVYDTAGSAAMAAAQATKAVDEGASIILGPVYAEAANAAGLAVRNRNVNVLSFSNNATIAGGNVFVLGPTFENAAMRLARYAADQGKRNIVVVHGKNLTGQMGYAAIQRAMASTSARMAGDVSYDVSQQGVIAAVPRVREMVSNTGADAVFFTSTTAGALPMFAQLLPEAGVTSDSTQFIGLTRWDIPPQTLSQPGVQGGWFTLPDPGRMQSFTARYSAAYGGAPHAIGGLAYDGIAIVGALVGNGKANTLSAAALTQGAGFEGVGGVLRLRGDGSNERGLAVATIQNKQVVVISPAPRSFSGAGS
ncbi:penicillin-binding protein activator [Pontibaca salina]|uniref:Penicillin-binding protein activator n=1 Tax=Pontibaca salina TaxID=2795731 RepID=A0A934HKS9_9RHOB|nr:penicillin-binding protein activator [Pontibaca salina]MBI6628681.1 penicillin-binding protein activator [Pontibaca salina]